MTTACEEKFREQLLAFFLSVNEPHQILGTFSNYRLMSESSRHWIKHKTEIKVKCVPDVGFAINPDGKADDLEVV